MYYQDPGNDKTTKLLKIAERALYVFIGLMGLALFVLIAGVTFTICVK